MGRIAVLGLNMVTIVILARAWGEEMFGIFSYALVVVGLFALLPDFGMQPVLIREMARRRSQAGEIVGLALFSKAVLAAIAFLLLAIATAVFYHEPRLRMALAWLSLTILISAKLNTLRVVLEGVFHADMDMGLPVVFQLVDGALQVALVGALVLIGATPGQVIAGYVLSNLPGLVLTVVYVQKRTRPVFRVERAELRWLFKESFPLFIYLGLTMLYERLDVLFLKSLWGEAAVGIYSTAFRFTAPLGFVPFAVATALYPVMARAASAEDEKLGLAFRMGVKGLLVIGLVLGVAGTIVGRPLFLLLFGERFAGAALSFQLLLWSQCFTFLTFFMVDFNNSRNRQGRNSLFMLCMLVLALPVQWWFIRRLGVTGAAWAKLMLNGAGLCVLFGLSWRALTGEQAALAWRAAAALALFVAIAVMYFLFGGPVLVFAVGLVALLLAGLHRLFTPQEKALLRQAMRTSIAVAPPAGIG
ncbi:MAG: flippase [Calditrichaeota bacterium]|nr:flippase [Calditrichota bacterium]